MLKRREVLGLLAAIGAGPALALEVPGPVQLREPWGRFRDGPDLAAFVAAVAALKANKDPRSPDSWAFWAGIHGSHCPHGKPYFLAWHRGYLFLFERKLRELAKSDTLRLPYWDYFTDPAVPAEFTKGNAGDNPLWEPRKGSAVGAALAYGAFDASVTGFERGAANGFEGKIESTPHNNIHNLVGGKMATMQSPQDVLFWLHHANVDRLWSAWLAAGQGRNMPAAGDAYWEGQFDYEAGLSVPRNGVLTCDALGYRYADLALPEPPPTPPAPPPPAPRVGAARARPPMVRSAPPGAAMDRNAAGQAGGLSLGDESVTITVPIGGRAPPPPMVTSAPGAAPQPPRPRLGTARNAGADADSGPAGISVILDEVTLTEIGAEGGFFYKVYLNLPGVGNDESRLAGTIGPFQIAAASHHGGTARIELPATDLVRRLARGRDPAELDALSVSFVRVNADGAPAGTVIGIGGFRIEGLAPR